MKKNKNSIIDSEELEHLKLQTKKHENKLKEMQPQIDIINNKLDSIIQIIEQTPFNSRNKFSEKISFRLNKFADRLILISIFLIAFSGISFAFLSSNVAELIAQVSFFSITMAIFIKTIFLLISKVKELLGRI